MATVNISIPDPMSEWVEERVKSGEYADASDYVRDLIQRDQATRDALIEALIKGERSGISKRTVLEIAAETRAKLENGKL